MLIRWEDIFSADKVTPTPSRFVWKMGGHTEKIWFLYGMWMSDMGIIPIQDEVNVDIR